MNMNGEVDNVGIISFLIHMSSWGCAYLMKFNDNATLLIFGSVTENETFEMAVAYFKETACTDLGKPRKCSEHQASEMAAE
jgi:hypothetical protein